MKSWFLKSFVLLCLVCVFSISLARWNAHQRETLDFADGWPADGRLIETPEGAIFVLERGDADAQPVLFAHGTAAWGQIWNNTLEAVAGEGYLATAFDMPPFGWSEYTEGNAYDRIAQASRVIALLETFDRPPLVVAHSVSAGPVSEAIMRRPELVSGYVIVSGAIGLDHHSAPKELPFLLKNRFVREYLTSATASNPMLTRRFLKSFMYRKEAATPEITKDLQRPMYRRGYTKAVSAWMPELFSPAKDALSLILENWANLDVPVQLIWGAQDETTPLEQGITLNSLIPRSSLITLDDVGHIPHLEAPEDFNKALIEQLSKIRTSE